MRSVALSAAGAAVLVAFASSALALGRVPKPNVQEPSNVVHVADLTAPAGVHRPYRADSYRNWRYRAAYVRWMHNELVRAGYPVKHPHLKTYARTLRCCTYRRDW